MNSFYSESELKQIGIKHYGKNVLISRYARIYSPHSLIIGDDVRIDDFCILSGIIEIGSRVHISAYSALYGSKGIVINDDSGVSARTIIYSAIDDFSGSYLIGPMQNENKTNVTGGLVTLERFTQVGAGSILFPNITIHEGTVVGAMSLVKQSTPEWCIYAGVPAKFIKKRSKRLLELL